MLVLSFAAYAGDFEEGKAAYEKGDFVTAIAKFKLAAEAGDANAQYRLGFEYEWGNKRGTTQNLKEAAKWYRLAAGQGNAHAQVQLGQLYYFGKGVIQNYREAQEWYMKAAMQGDLSGQGFLSQSYEQQSNYLMAYVWANIFTSNSDISSGAKTRDWLATQLTPKQLADAQALAKRCVESNYKNCE